MVWWSFLCEKDCVCKKYWLPLALSKENFIFLQSLLDHILDTQILEHNVYFQYQYCVLLKYLKIKVLSVISLFRYNTCGFYMGWNPSSDILRHQILKSSSNTLENTTSADMKLSEDCWYRLPWHLSVVFSDFMFEIFDLKFCIQILIL